MCIMPRAVFMDILEKSPPVNRIVMRRLTALIRQLSVRLSEYSFLQAKHRLYAELLRMSHPRSGHAGQRSISPPPIQREIADRIASRREVVSREMKMLEREQIIEKTRGALIIHNVLELNKRIMEGWRD
jgi:CRP-like cAMP-binding protein